MPATIRFRLDENCSHAIAVGVRRRGIDVTTSPEVGLLGVIDADQLAYCLARKDESSSVTTMTSFGWPPLDSSMPELPIADGEKRSIGDIVRAWSSSGNGSTRRTWLVK